MVRRPTSISALYRASSRGPRGRDDPFIMASSSSSAWPAGRSGRRGDDPSSRSAPAACWASSGDDGEGTRRSGRRPRARRSGDPRVVVGLVPLLLSMALHTHVHTVGFVGLGMRRPMAATRSRRRGLASEREGEGGRGRIPEGMAERGGVRPASSLLFYIGGVEVCKWASSFPRKGTRSRRAAQGTDQAGCGRLASGRVVWSIGSRLGTHILHVTGETGLKRKSEGKPLHRGGLAEGRGAGLSNQPKARICRAGVRRKKMLSFWRSGRNLFSSPRMRCLVV